MYRQCITPDRRGAVPVLPCFHASLLPWRKKSSTDSIKMNQLNRMIKHQFQHPIPVPLGDASRLRLDPMSLPYRNTSPKRRAHSQATQALAVNQMTNNSRESGLPRAPELLREALESAARRTGERAEAHGRSSEKAVATPSISGGLGSRRLGTGGERGVGDEGLTKRW